MALYAASGPGIPENLPAFLGPGVHSRLSPESIVDACGVSFAPWAV